MTIRTLVTIIVGPLGELPQFPALTLEWDEAEDGDIEEEFFDSHGFRMALGLREGMHLEAFARDSTEEEKRAWQSAYDAWEEENGPKPPRLFINDLLPRRH